MGNKLKDKDSNIRRNRKKNKKKKKARKFLLFILIILIIVVSWFTYKTYKNGGGLSGFLATAVGHDENTKKNLPELKVLLLGVSTDLDSELTDTVMVASYNPNTQKARLLSIPRDTFTGKDKSKATASQKLNALYNINRTPDRTLKAVNEITGLDIKYYVIVKTEALIKLVDAIGGVEFNVPINMYYTDKTQNLVINLKQGVQTINGEKAEQLLRFRHNNDGSSYPVEYGDNDFGRMRTQREFITATLKQTLKASNIFKLGEIIDIVHQNLETNLDVSYLKDYLPYAVEFKIENLQNEVLPVTTPSLKETNNVSVVIVNKQEANKLIKEMFFSDLEEDKTSQNTTTNTSNAQNTNVTSNSSYTNTQNTSTANNSSSTNKNPSSNSSNTQGTDINKSIKIEILNGSGNSKNLDKAKKLLEDAGYSVTKTGNTSTISKTIITNKKDVSDEALKQIKQKLGTGSISNNKSSTSLVDITIIIGKDFDK